MLKFFASGKFKKEYKKLIKSGKDKNKFSKVALMLLKGEPLPEKYKDHKLKGKLKDRRECHIEPDWLLIYKIEKDRDRVVFERTGSHSDLFEKM